MWEGGWRVRGWGKMGSGVEGGERSEGVKL